jgi:hypothetical protein
MSHLIFHEAISHSRKGTELKELLAREFKDLHPYSGLSFYDIFQRVSTLCTLGPLHVYDITAAICRYHHIHIDKIYIVGNGPKIAAGLLHLKTKSDAKDKRLRYIEMADTIRALTKHNIPLLHSTNGDDFESYLCKWQSTLPRDKNNKKYIPDYPKK